MDREHVSSEYNNYQGRALALRCREPPNTIRDSMSVGRLLNPLVKLSRSAPEVSEHEGRRLQPNSKLTEEDPEQTPEDPRQTAEVPQNLRACPEEVSEIQQSTGGSKEISETVSEVTCVGRPRPPYTQEQRDWVFHIARYHTSSWDEITILFEARYGFSRRKSGLQSLYYRKCNPKGFTPIEDCKKRRRGRVTNVRGWSSPRNDARSIIMAAHSSRYS